jgi:hypothetical protein
MKLEKKIGTKSSRPTRTLRKIRFYSSWVASCEVGNYGKETRDVGRRVWRLESREGMMLAWSR